QIRGRQGDLHRTPARTDRAAREILPLIRKKSSSGIMGSDDSEQHSEKFHAVLKNTYTARLLALAVFFHGLIPALSSAAPGRNLILQM
ncbi:hypothetical protein, partial [uncultured Victivallis sp.]|uniref:hypothetical protein n=1 Tax=uncultured Victivallis sp. TaxID=354118 RepID=UPI0025D7B42D